MCYHCTCVSYILRVGSHVSICFYHIRIPHKLRVCVCSVGCGCDQCLQCCCISSLHAQSLFNNYNPTILPGTKPAVPFQTSASTTFTSQMQNIHATTKWSLEKSCLTNESPIRQKEMTCHRLLSRQQGLAWHDQPPSSWPKKKLTDKRTGPFEIKAKKGASAYTLKLLTNWHIHPTFNEALITLYTLRPFQIKNNHHHHQTLLAMKNITKLKKF